MHILGNGSRISVKLRSGHCKKLKCAVSESRARSERNKCIHIRRTVNYTFESVHEKMLIYDHDRDGQKKLRKSHRHMIFLKEPRERPIPHHVSHGEVHEHRKERKRCDKSFPESGRFAVLESIGAAVFR